MLFNSHSYLFAFLPVALLVFVLLRKADRNQPALLWLVAASLFFYGYWEPRYLLLIALSITANFGIGYWVLGIGYRLGRRNPNNRRAWLITGLVFNLGLFGYFKYTGFSLKH